MTILRVTILFLVMTGLSGPALAQIGGQGGPMDISADRLETFDTERRAMFSGNVDAAQGEANLRSDALEVFFSPRSGSATGTGASWGEIDRVIATGEVFYVTPNEIARGERAVYQLAAQTIVMTGGVTLRRGDNVIEGDCLVVDLETNNSQINAPACRGEALADTDQNTGRVRGVFFPSASEPEDDDTDDNADAEG
jgi:lipopolysaccharide export system protein LptA